MKIWTGKICLALASALRPQQRHFLSLPLISIAFLGMASCESSSEKKAAPPHEVPNEVSLKGDRAEIERLRKDIPEEVKKSNDRLGDTLSRWKAQKMEPDRLREKFNDEIRKLRNALDAKQKKAREDFQRDLAEKRKNFLDKLKSDRESFYASKPTSEKRSDFSNNQQSDRDRFFGDERDTRADFDDSIKDERKLFEDDIAERWVEFRQEFPEYSRIWREMKAAEEKEHEENLQNPKPYDGKWPYKFPGEEDGNSNGAAASGQAPGQTGGPKSENVDVNKGGNGWPTSDPSEFNQIPGQGSGH